MEKTLIFIKKIIKILLTDSSDFFIHPYLYPVWFVSSSRFPESFVDYSDFILFDYLNFRFILCFYLFYRWKRLYKRTWIRYGSSWFSRDNLRYLYWIYSLSLTVFFFLFFQLFIIFNIFLFYYWAPPFFDLNFIKLYLKDYPYIFKQIAIFLPEYCDLLDLKEFFVWYLHIWYAFDMQNFLTFSNISYMLLIFIAGGGFHFFNDYTLDKSFLFRVLIILIGFIIFFYLYFFFVNFTNFFDSAGNVIRFRFSNLSLFFILITTVIIYLFIYALDRKTILNLKIVVSNLSRNINRKIDTDPFEVIPNIFLADYIEKNVSNKDSVNFLDENLFQDFEEEDLIFFVEEEQKNTSNFCEEDNFFLDIFPSVVCDYDTVHCNYILDWLDCHYFMYFFDSIEGTNQETL